jgi:hypothetical protein
METKEKAVGVFWGVVLILLGVWFLVTRTTSLQFDDPRMAMVLTGGLSLAFFVSYFISGPNRIGWLFPACILAGVTLTILLGEIVGAPEGGWMAAPILLGIAVPFLVIYLQDREKNRWALIPTYVLVAITIVAGFSDVLPGELEGTLSLLMIGLAFLGVYLLNRKHRWALVVFIILAVVSLIPAFQASVYIWPVVLIIGGALLVFQAYRKKGGEKPSEDL